MFPTNLVHFSKSEDWGDADAMHEPLLRELDKLRTYLSLPIIITCGTQGFHAKNSWHFKGRAVDFIIPNTQGKSSLDLTFDVLRFGFTGVGVYSSWKYQGKQVLGFHVEIAEPKPQQKKLWLSILDQFARQSYVAMSEENFKKLSKALTA